MVEWRRGPSPEPEDDLPLFPGVAPAIRTRGRSRSRAHARADQTTSADTAERARLLTVADVCDRLQCGRTYVYALLQQRILRAVKLGRLTRIPLSEFEEFIAHKVADAQYDVCERWSRGGDRAAM